MKGLYKGVTSPLLGQAAINALVFGVEAMVYQRLGSDGADSLNVEKSVMAGMCAGAVQTLIASPMELVKIRMQNQSIGKEYTSWTMRKLGKAPTPQAGFSQDYRGPLETTLHILRKEGLRRGLFKGWWLTLFREVPQFGIYFGSYAWIRLKLMDLTGKGHPDQLGVVWLSLAGGVTGVLTWLWYPVDVIKSRFQDDRGKRYSGMVDCVRKSVRSEGVRVLVKGMQPTLVRGFLNGFATLPVYTLLMRLLHNSTITE